MWILLLFVSGCIFSMERADSLVVVTSSAAAAASGSSVDLFASPEEKDELFTRALYTVYPMGYDQVNDRLKGYLDRIITQRSGLDEDDDIHQESNITILRRLRSGDLQERHENYIKGLVMRATSQAFEDQQRHLDEQLEKVEKQQRKIESKMSKKESALIALVASIVASTASVLVAVYSQK